MQDANKIPEEVQEAINKYLESTNLSPREEFDNLSAEDMFFILHKTFEEGSPLQYKQSISNQSLEKIPFFSLFRIFLGKIKEAGQLKLTARGNLPIKICRELYDSGFIREKFMKYYSDKMIKEQDSAALSSLKIVGTLSGVLKKRNNKLSLTKSGEKLFNAEDQLPLFKKIFETNIFRFNMGYGDGYPQENGIQSVIGYTFYMLLRYGHKKRNINFYGKKNLEAFPMLPADFRGGWFTPEQECASCYEYRIFEKFLNSYGFVDLYEERRSLLADKKMEVIATDSFRDFFEIRKENFRFKKSEFRG